MPCVMGGTCFVDPWKLWDFLMENHCHEVFRMYWINPPQRPLWLRPHAQAAVDMGEDAAALFRKLQDPQEVGIPLMILPRTKKMWGPFMNLTFFAMGIWDFGGFQTWSTEVQGDMCQASTLSGPLVHLTLWGCRKLGLRKMTSSCSFMFILIPLSYACRHSIFMHLESRIRDDSVGFVCQSYVFPI